MHIEVALIRAVQMTLVHNIPVVASRLEENVVNKCCCGTKLVLPSSEK